jgi:hypothetical protein
MRHQEYGDMMRHRVPVFPNFNDLTPNIKGVIDERNRRQYRPLR